MRLRRNRRRGMILLVVLVMLTLFAIAGLTFVLYAEAASESARFNKDAESYSVSNAPDMDPTQSLDLFLGQLIYGLPDPTTTNANGGFSALRGHSLAETMYGSYDSNPGNVPSDVPYNGTGRLSEPSLVYPNVDGNQMVNYTYFPADGFLRDPSRPGTRANNSLGRKNYTGGQNPPYTYPDTNSMFLASVQLVNVSGQMVPQVMTQSYYRSSTGIGPMNPDPNPTTNPIWDDPNSSAAYRYMTLRPRPADMGPSFPPPASTTGDVKNISGLSGGNDSIWIDVNAPELYTASGLRYKMLVAPLVLDLDNKINLNVVGNVLASYGASGSVHAGNQGWGQWEVNMGRVLNAPAAPNEWENVFFGNGAVSGRYGSGTSALPASTFPLSGPAPHIYAPADLNGVNDPGQPNPFTATMAWSLPAGTACFPTFPSQGYGNGGPLETTNNGNPPPPNGNGTDIHPMFYNPMNPANPNRLLPLWSHATMMYAGAAASQNGDLSKVCPNNFPPNSVVPVDPNPAATLRRIYDTTLLSMELDRPGASPYLSDAAAPSNYTEIYNPATGTYTFTPGQQSFPNVATHTSTVGPAPGAEFDPRTWRSTLPNLLSRMDLDRQLTPYSAANGWAQPADRQQFANDIFTRLLAVTGMTSVYNNLQSNSTPPTFGSAQYNTLRWLAQLSANIVDYIDTDDIMTAFQWTTNPQAPDTGYVYGTELPKLVVNELYLEYDNDPNDPGMVNNPNPPPPQIKGATQKYHVNVWAELVNPLPSGADANGSNNANLVSPVTNTAAYQLVLTKPNQGLRNADNTLGNPDGPTPPNAPYATQPYTPTGTYNPTPGQGQVISVVNSWGAVQSVPPVGTGASAGQGFLVVGPTPNPGAPLTAAQQTQIQPPAMSAGLSTTLAGMTYTVNNDANGETPVPPTLMLQRLANPNVAWNLVSNPWVTVDYIDASQIANTSPANATPPSTYTNTYTRTVNNTNPAITATWYPVINDARTYNDYGTNPNFVANPNLRYSYGRMEPYAAVVNPTQANLSQWQQQTAAPANPSSPTCTFFAPNLPATQQNGQQAYHWLVHMDRPLVSPVELAGVSAFKPHELTQQFIANVNVSGTLTPTPYQHLAPWQDQTSRLYRLLEFVKTSNPTPGLVNGGRIPGRVNINTVDPSAKEIFYALCDPEPGNNFTQANADTAFAALQSQQLWGMAPGAAAGGDAMGTTPRGIAQTLLAGASNWTSGTNPYQQLELLNKVYNNSTTRSNVFAVWLTVGFFQITDDTTQPMKLGPEINAGQGKNIRHHMFAIVDRTQIQTWQQGMLKTNQPIAAGTASISVPTSVTDPRTGLTWTIQATVPPNPGPAIPGTTLVYDPGVYNTNPALPNEETVVVQAGYTANFQYPHNQGATVISRGNPGPWNLPGALPYNVTQDGQVVPYWVIID